MVCNTINIFNNRIKYANNSLNQWVKSPLIVVWALLGILILASVPAIAYNIGCDMIASATVPTSAGAVVVPLNSAAITKLNYCREHNKPFWFGVKSTAEETKLLWFYDPIQFYVNNVELSPIPTGYIGFPYPGVDKHNVNNQFGYEPNHWNYLVSGHYSGFEAGMVTRGLMNYSITGTQPITSAEVHVPSSVATYSGAGVEYYFVVFQIDFTFAWDDYPYNSDYPNASGTPVHNDSELARRIFIGVNTPICDPTNPPWYSAPAYKKSGDPVYLSTGEEVNSAGVDIEALNPVTGSKVGFTRSYSTALAKRNYSSSGLPVGWTHSWDVHITGSETPSAWENLSLKYDNGASDEISPELDNNGYPTGNFIIAAAAPYIITGVPGENIGCWESILITDRSGIKQLFTLHAAGVYALTSVTNTLDTGISLSWDTSRRLTDIKTLDATSTLLHLSYDEDGMLTQVDDVPGSRKITYTHDSISNSNPPVYRLLSVSQTATSAAENLPDRWSYTYYGYNGAQLLTSITQPGPTGDEVSLAFSYDAETGRVASQTNANGVKEQYTYNIDNTIVTTYDDENNSVQSWTHIFDGNGRDIGSLDAENHGTTKVYGNPNFPASPTHITGPDGKYVDYTYDTKGNLLTTTDSAGMTVTNRYDYADNPFGRLVSIQQTGKPAVTFSYSEPTGLPKTVSGAKPGTTGTQRVTTTFTYDFEAENSTQQHGLPIAVSGPGNGVAGSGDATISYNYTSDAAYDEDGAPGSMTLEVPYCKPLTVTDKHNRTSHMRYDARGNVIITIAPNGARTDIAYNIADQPVRILYQQEKTGAGRKMVVTDYRFPGGFAYQTSIYTGRTSIDDTTGGTLLKQVSITYDSEGQILGTTGSDEPASYIYDALGRLKTLTDAAAHVTTYDYDIVGRLVTVTDPGNHTVSNTAFDVAGRLLSSEDESGAETNYTYDTNTGQLTAVTHVGDISSNVSYSYNADRSIASITDATQTRIYTYDSLGNPLTVTTVFKGNPGHADLPAQVVSYHYNADGSLASLHAPAGKYTYQRDADGRVISVTNPAGRVSRWKYLADGKLDKQTLGNRAWEKYAYDAVGALAGTNGYNPKGRLLTTYGSFTNDDLGRLTGQKATTPGAPGTTGTNIWGYSTTGQLTSDGYTPNIGNNSTNATTFDAVGNPTHFVRELAGYTDGSYVRHYDVNNQWDGYYKDNTLYNTVGNVPNADPLFAYDDKGNPTLYKGEALSYDSQNRLTQYADQLSAGYRSDGLRAWKEVNGVRTYFLYAGGQLIAELDESGTLKTTYTWGPRGLLNRTNLQTNQEVWYLFDPQGNVAQRLDDSGKVLSTDQYDAWGNLITGGDTTDPCGYRAQFGYYTDHETGLILCGHRYYDPIAGRWLTRDPIGVAGGINLYKYCKDSPVINNDPLGLISPQEVLIDALIGGVVGGVIGGLIGGASNVENLGDWSQNGFMRGFIAGMLGGAAFGATSNMLIAEHAASMTTGGAIIWGAVSGGISGAVSALSKEVYDAVQGKSQGSIWCSVKRIATGAIIGAFTGGGMGNSVVAGALAEEALSGVFFTMERVYDAVITGALASLDNLRDVVTNASW